MPLETNVQRRVQIPYLNGLRGVAILMVVMIHVSLLVAGLSSPAKNLTFYGVRGVQLFFIVSGLTLTMNYRGRSLNLADFAVRRYFRIAPMFYLGAALYVLLGITTGLRFAPKNATVGEILGTLTFLHGWSVEAHNKIVPGGWSIAAEAMFYLAFPLLLMLSYRRRLFTVAVAGLYVLAAITYFALRRFVPGEAIAVQSFAFSFWLCQFPAFATGCWLALGWGGSRVSRAAAGFIATGAVIAMIVDSQLRGHSNLLISIILLATFVWAIGRLRPAILERGPLPFIGEISFSLYILHFMIVALLASVAAPLEQQAGPVGALAVLYGLTLLVGAPLAALTYRFVEKPFIAYGRGHLRPNLMGLEAQVSTAPSGPDYHRRTAPGYFRAVLLRRFVHNGTRESATPDR